MEKEILDDLKSEKSSPEIKKHVSECPSCKNLVAVHDWMNRYQQRALNIEMLSKSLPSADTIWNRGYAKRPLDKTLVKKALRPLAYTQVLYYAVIITGVFLLLRSNAEKIRNIIDSRVFAQILPIFLIPLIIVLLSMAFCALVVAFEWRKKRIENAQF